MKLNRYKLALCSVLLASSVFMSPTLWSQTKGSPVRLAIITGSTTSAPVADLLTVELSGKTNLQMLERAEIEKAYREQELSASNRDFLKLGQVLGADGLLLLTPAGEGTNQFMQVRLVAVKPGVVIGAVRSVWPVSDQIGWARWLANHFGPLFSKLGVRAKDALPISVLNLRAAVKSAEEEAVERQLTVLAIERLTHERPLFVLERRRMELLSAEKELQGMNETAFWNGSYLLEGVIDRDGYSKENVTVHARLVPPKGGAPVPIEISGSRTNLAALINQLVSKVMAGLNIRQPSAPWSPVDEAEQYFTEGIWAYRWKMLPEAQAASESAWALGKRTKEVAALRVRAYCDEIGSSPVSGNIEIPMVPRPASLKAAIRGLSLFCQGWPLGVTGTNTLDDEWFGLGLYKALRPAAAVLDGYYHAAELRSGNEEQLAELRSLVRRVVAVLDQSVPPGWLPNGRINRPQRMDQEMRRRWAEGGQYWQNGKTLWHYQWEQGGLWFEKPAEALPMFHRVLEAGYRPSSLPRVIGWSWPDRKRVPGVVRQFVEQACTSTNPAVRLEGLYLAVVRAPFDAERQDRRCTEELLAALWGERERIWSNPDDASLFERTEAALAHKYYVWSSPVGVEPFASFKQRFRIEYLQNAAAYNDQVFRVLFPYFSTYCSLPEARVLLPHLEAFNQRLNLSKAGEPRSTDSEAGAGRRRRDDRKSCLRYQHQSAGVAG